MKTLIEDLRKNNYNDESLYHRAADRIEELEAVIKETVEDLLLRAEIGEEGGKIVSISGGTWIKLKKVIE